MWLHLLACHGQRGILRWAFGACPLPGSLAVESATAAGTGRAQQRHLRLATAAAQPRGTASLKPKEGEAAALWALWTGPHPQLPVTRIGPPLLHENRRRALTRWISMRPGPTAVTGPWRMAARGHGST